VVYERGRYLLPRWPRGSLILLKTASSVLLVDMDEDVGAAAAPEM
jgi:hypothetical protein